MQQMRRRVVRPDRGATIAIDLQLGCVADTDLALGHLGLMDVEVTGPLADIADPRQALAHADLACIAHLAARLRIERSLIQDDLDALAGLRALDLGAVMHQRPDHALGVLALIAQELGRAHALAQVKPQRLLRRTAGARPSRARLLLLGLHGGVESVHINNAPLLAQRVLGQVQREAVSVVEPERCLARQRRAIGQLRQFIFQQSQAPVQRPAETVLLMLQRLGDHRLAAHKLGEGLAHLLNQRRHQPVHQRSVDTQEMRMPHGAPHDPAQHIAPPFVRGQHPVGDEKRGRAQVVGDHPVMHLSRSVGRPIGLMRARLDQCPHQVGVIDIMLALKDRADPLEPHAGVDRGFRQVRAAAVLELLELHEDQVPDLDKPVAILIRATGRPAGDFGPVVVENLRAWAAGASRPHHPEIVRGGDADDPFVRQARMAFPDRCRLIVIMKDSHRQPFGRKAELLGHQIPSQGDRPLLEIVAEREVPQHLEEG